MNVLVYVDGSEGSLRALAKDGVEITALHVFPPRLDRDVVSHFEIEEEDLDAAFAHKVVDEVAGRFAAAGVSGHTKIIEGPIAEVICDQGEAGGFDLILLAGRSHRVWGLSEISEIVQEKSSRKVEVVY
jgi:nucleotide-binding universal stress UspA family protein